MKGPFINALGGRWLEACASPTALMRSIYKLSESSLCSKCTQLFRNARAVALYSHDFEVGNISKWQIYAVLSQAIDWQKNDN
jgi:hypothetical protein